MDDNGICVLSSYNRIRNEMKLSMKHTSSNKIMNILVNVNNIKDVHELCVLQSRAHHSWSPQKNISPLPFSWHCEQMKVLVFLQHLIVEQEPCCVYVVATCVSESVFLNCFGIGGGEMGTSTMMK